jgi:glycosyltransferase involved in cell wall biosynthesis
MKRILFIDSNIHPSSHLGGAGEGLYLMVRDLKHFGYECAICSYFPNSRLNIYSKVCSKVFVRISNKYIGIVMRKLIKFKYGGFLFKLIMSYNLNKILEDFKPDILHVNLLQKWDFFDQLHAKSKGVKIVGHVRTLPNQATFKYRDLKLCDAVICVSSYVHDAFKKIYGNVDFVKIYNGIDIDKYLANISKSELRDSLGLAAKTESSLLFLSVGSLIPRKGHDLAIQSFSVLINNGIDASLAIVGSSYNYDNDCELDRLSVIAKSLNVYDKVFFIGQCDEMGKAYALADIVYALSHDGEAFGRVPIEAAISKVPIIATRLGATPELVQADVTGILVEPGDINDIVKKTMRLLNERGFYQSIVEAANKFARLNFCSSICAQRTSELYSKLIDLAESNELNT